MNLTIKQATDYIRSVIANRGSEPYQYNELNKYISYLIACTNNRELTFHQLALDSDSQQKQDSTITMSSIKVKEFLDNYFLVMNSYQLEKPLNFKPKKWDNYSIGVKTSERKNSLAVERAHSHATDKILANVFPPNITERLIKGEKKIADTYENVSVLFIDIVGFTKIADKIRADELIDLLDMVFTRFDAICKKHGLEKIKTIGDAYMAVCGAPVSRCDHAERTALAAIDMLENISIEQRFSVPIQLGFRIGLHSGSVVAGIIGEDKYSYDLWGDAVNTASRMESHGEENKIHVSEEFVKAICDSRQSTFQFIPRGEMMIKGKGKMRTYFLERVMQ
ncbi:MAG: adenylate/guanylate cyclase domain-containing protein [Bacteroidetes bacterium]|nr:adenylate/guanylate cyclase domain-containing protein [Bacteroidota bacterium]